MADSIDHDIRYSEMNDETDLQRWLSDPKEWKWFPFSSEEEKRKVVKNWIGFSKFKASLTATIEEEPCAIGTLFLMPYIKVAHHCMFYLIVDPKYRKKGIGSSLLKNLLHLSKTYFRHEFIHTEIYEDCPMYFLLKKFSFYTYAKQDFFVKEDGKYSKKLFLQHDFE